MGFRHHIRTNLIFLVVAHIAWLTEPAIVHAQNGSYEPINFTQPLSVGRGTITPVSQGSIYLDHAEACSLAKQEFGWTDADCSSMSKMIFFPTPEIDTLIVNKPTDEGRISMDDWKSDMTDEIDQLTEGFKDTLREQSKDLGVKIEFTGWKVYPQVDRNLKVLYYAFILDWDGDPVINLKLTKLDRYGSVVMNLVPVDSNASTQELEVMIADVVGMYKAKPGNSYAEWKSGDKVAAIGTVGLLATLIGVNYGKSIWAAVVAFSLIILKKAWFIILLPFVFLRRLFSRRGGE